MLDSANNQSMCTLKLINLYEFFELNSLQLLQFHFHQVALVRRQQGAFRSFSQAAICLFTLVE